MTSTLQLQRRARRIVPAVVIAVGLLLISAIMFQQVAAQDSGTLKPPFKLNRTGPVSSFELHGPVALPLSAPIIMSQTFDSTYYPTTTLNALGWHESYIGGATSQYTWEYVGMAPLTDTVWSARRNPGGLPRLDPATDTYTKGMQALLIYGPLNLTDYTKLVMTGTYWLDTAGRPLDDYLGVAFSTDGTNWEQRYAESASDPSLSQSHVFYASLDEVARKPVVWIALIFVSNDDDQVGRGAFVKDVVLRANPAYKIFLPLIRLDPTPTPTLTPTPSFVYDYTFGSGQSTDAQFATWGGKVTDADCTTADAGGCQWGQNIVTSGHPGGAMHMYQNGLNALAGASPNNLAPTDFELSADFYAIQGKSDSRLGLVFGASDNAFGRSGGTPYFDPYRNMYKFDLQFNENDNTVMSYYRLQKFVTASGGYETIVDKSILPSGLVGHTGTWNNIKIQRLGTKIKVYVNGSQLIDVNDGTYIGSKKYGLFLQSKGLNSAGNPLRIYFDNVQVRALP
jgi:hypothetical protein